MLIENLQIQKSGAR